MHIATLRMFCDLASLQSFSKTAEKHFLSQSAVSQQLAGLELGYKCQLVNRKKRPIELTKEGQILYEAARDIIGRYEQLQNELNALKSSAGSRISVGAIFSIGMHTLSGYVKKFMVKYPNVNMHLEYLSAEKIYELVLSGDLDIGLVAIPKKDKRLEVYSFEDEPLVMVCGPRHPWAGELEIDIHRIQFERFISFESEVPTRKWIDNILQSYNISVQPVMEFDNIETIKRAVEINSGISILPKPAILQELKEGTLKSVSFSEENFIRPTGIIVHKNKILSPAGRYLLKLLQKQAQ